VERVSSPRTHDLRPSALRYGRRFLSADRLRFRYRCDLVEKTMFDVAQVGTVLTAILTASKLYEFAAGRDWSFLKNS